VGEGGERVVEVRDSTGVVVGDGNTQINYTYNALAVTGGVAPPPLVSVHGVVESPYRGLNPFEDGEEAFFFGRGAAAAEIATLITGKLTAPGLVMVSGESGAGKSSLLRAGVVPQMRAASMTYESPGTPVKTAAARPWPCLVITPTRRPLDELALRVAPLAGASAAVIRRELAADPAGFALTARQAAAGNGLVLVVDQFEELFTQCPDGAEDERRAFITALHAAATTESGSAGAPAALVVLGVRADFEARCARYPLLADAVQDRYMLMPMTERQLRLAITEPAVVAGSRVEDELVTELLREAQSQSNALPLLSYALDQAWRNRAGDTLRLADYERVGGLEGSVAASAGQAYASLGEAQQIVARQVFMRLTATNAEGQVSAARATRAELETGADPGDVGAVLEAFAGKSARLLTLGTDSVSISHEVLLTAWDRLHGWLDGELDDRVRYTRLRADARAWDASRRPASYLYSAGRLAELAATERRWATIPGRYPSLDEVSTAFVTVARRGARAARRRQRWIMALLSVLTVAAATTAGVAVHLAADSAHNAAVANQQHAISLSRQFAAESLAADPSDPLTARQLAVAAWSVAHTGQASAAMTTLATEQWQQGMLPVSTADVGVDEVAFSPDGTLLATASGGNSRASGIVQLWDMSTRQRVGAPLTAGAGGQAAGMTFSPDGRLLAIASSKGIVRLWDMSTRRPAGAPLAAGTGSEAAGMRFIGDGRLLLTVGDDGTVRVWSTSTGHLMSTRSQPRGSAVASAFSPDGKLVAIAYSIGGGNAVRMRLWNTSTGQPVSDLMPYDTTAYDGIEMQFSPDDRLLATTENGFHGKVLLWNTATGKLAGGALPVDLAPNGNVNDVKFSPDGKLLATAGSDGTVRLWSMPSGHPVSVRLRAASSGSSGYPCNVQFSPDGKLLATTSCDGAVRLWSTATGQPVSAFSPVNASLDSQGVAFSPDGRLLATAFGDGVVRLWGTATGQPVGASMPSGGDAQFSPDGKLLATPDSNSRGGTVQLWNPDTGQPASAALLADPGGSVTDAQFSPDGKLLAALAGSGTVRLWNTATLQPFGKPLPASTGSEDIGNVMAFSPDGRLLAATDNNSHDRKVRLWSTANLQPFGRPLPADNAVDALAFSPDSSLLATIGEDSHGGIVRLWNPATGQPVGHPIAMGDGNVFSLAFSPDGKLLAVTDNSRGGAVRLLNSATLQPTGKILTATGSPGEVLNMAFSPDSKLLATADIDNGRGTIRLWDPATGQPIGDTLVVDPGTDGVARSVAFSPDGRLLATDEDDSQSSTAQLWDVPLLTDPYAALCTDAGPPTQQEWKQYAPNEQFPKICS
jgi:WD40 repeat protein